MSDETLGKLLHHALSLEEAGRAIQVEGRRELATPLFDARSVIVEARS